MSTDTGDRVAAAEALVSHLVVAVTALTAGVVTGGWLAFETGYWQAFKNAIEGLAGATVVFVVGLLAVTAVVTGLATYRRSSA